MDARQNNQRTIDRYLQDLHRDLSLHTEVLEARQKVAAKLSGFFDQFGIDPDPMG